MFRDLISIWEQLVYSVMGKKDIFLSLYYYLIDIVNTDILSLNFLFKTTKCPSKWNIWELLPPLQEISQTSQRPSWSRPCGSFVKHVADGGRCKLMTTSELQHHDQSREENMETPHKLTLSTFLWHHIDLNHLLNVFAPIQSLKWIM